MIGSACRRWKFHFVGIFFNFFIKMKNEYHFFLFSVWSIHRPPTTNVVMLDHFRQPIFGRTQVHSVVEMEVNMCFGGYQKCCWCFIQRHEQMIFSIPSVLGGHCRAPTSPYRLFTCWRFVFPQNNAILAKVCVGLFHCLFLRTSFM